MKGTFVGAQTDIGDDVTVLPGEIPYAIKEMGFAAAVDADDHLERRAAITDVIGQVLVFEDRQVRINAGGEELKAVLGRNAFSANRVDNVPGDAGIELCCSHHVSPVMRRWE